ncbi:MAG TPA: dephospho-CoA kinase [Lachnospiraceae bacterium]|nr:dephospho-CoA kinase [Lachnospiraceae bacterium]
MFVLGITGGVGSGKTLVAKFISKKCNACLLIADRLGHIVMEPESTAFEKVTGRFGKDIVDSDGRIDRKKLADIIFNDDGARDALNSIIHPEVMSYIKKYISDRKDEDGIIVVETAIMYETGCDKLCDEIWYVYVPADIRIKRLSDSRGYSEEKSRSIIESQKPDKFFTDRADRIIDNSGNKSSLNEAISALSANFVKD